MGTFFKSSCLISLACFTMNHTGLLAGECTNGTCSGSSCAGTAVSCNTTELTTDTEAMCVDEAVITIGVPVSNLGFTLCFVGDTGLGISNAVNSGTYIELGPIITTQSGQIITYTQASSGMSDNIVWISNPSNDFTGSTIILQSGILQIGTSDAGNTVSGLSEFFFAEGGAGGNVELSAPYGMTTTANVSFQSGADATEYVISGGTSSSTILNLKGSLLNGGDMTTVSLEVLGYVNFEGSGNTYTAPVSIGNGGVVTASTTGSPTIGSLGTGVLTINTGGILIPSVSGAITNSSIVMAGGTLQFGYSGTFSSPINFSSTDTNTVNTNGYTVTLSSVLSGTESMIVNDSAGTGTLIISNANAFTQGISLNAGSLSWAGTSQMGTGVITWNGGNLSGLGNGTASNTFTLAASDLTFDCAGGNVTISGTLNQASGVTANLTVAALTGSGQLTLTGDVDYTGTTTVGATSGLAATLSIDLINNFSSSSITVDQTGVLLIKNTAGSVRTLPPISGAGILSLESDDFQTSGNSITIGVLNFATSGSLSLTNSGDVLTITGSSASTVSGTISGSGAVVIQGTANFSTANTFSGGLTLSGSTCFLTIQEASNLGTGTIIGSGGQLQYSSSTPITVTNAWNFTGGTETTIAGAFNLTGAISSTGSGTATIKKGGSETLSLNPSSVTLNSGSSLATNGNNISTASLAGSGTLLLGGTGHTDILTITGTTTFSGIISNGTSGLGSVVIDADTDTVTFSGSNTFTGGVTLTSGTLSISAVGNVGATTGIITGNGGTLSVSGASITLSNPFVFNAGTETTFNIDTSGSILTLSGHISSSGTGTSTIAKSGSGSLSLNPASLTLNSGSNLATNGSSITTASVSGSGGLILGSSAGTDTLTITGATNYSGIISNAASGSGAVVINASGDTVILSGRNTFSGGVTLTAGVLSISAADNLGASTGTITGNGGTLTVSANSFTLSNPFDFSASTDTTFNIAQTGSTLTITGTISQNGSGTAQLTKEGSGTLDISSEEIDSGTYDIVINDGSVSFNSTSTSVSSLYHFNDGILRGYQDRYFALADGMHRWKTSNVSIDPAIVNVTVNEDAILRGRGRVTNVVVNERGAISPGTVDQEIASFEIEDSLVFEEGSSYLVRMNGTDAALLNIGGPATIASDVVVGFVPKAGEYKGDSRIILIAGDLEGTFTQVESPASYFLDVSLDYSVPNQIRFSYAPRSIRSLAQGANAIAVSNALDDVINWNRTHVDYEVETFDPANPDFPLLGMLLETVEPFTTEGAMTNALNQLHSAFFKGLTIVQEDNIVKVQDTLNQRMNYILDTTSCYRISTDKESTCCNKDDKIFHGWMAGIGDVLAQKSTTYEDSPLVGYQSKMWGFTAGIDGHFAKVLYLGGVGGYTTSFAKFYDNQGSGNIESGYAGIYLSAIGEMFYGNLSVIGGFSNFSGNRNIDYPGVSMTAKNNHAGKQVLSHADTGFNWNIGGFTIRPFDAFDYVAQKETAYSEENAGEWNLSVDSASAILMRNELGLQLSSCFCLGSSKWVFSPKASWVREVRVHGDTYTATFTQANNGTYAPFTVTGYFPDRNLFSPGATLTGAMCQDRFTVTLNYNGEFTHGYSDHSYGIEARYAF